MAVDLLLAPPAQLDRSTARDVSIDESVRARLNRARSELKTILYDGKGNGTFRVVIASWYSLLSKECEESTDDAKVCSPLPSVMQAPFSHFLLRLPLNLVGGRQHQVDVHAAYSRTA